MKFRTFLESSSITAEQIIEDCDFYFSKISLKGKSSDWMYHGTRIVAPTDTVKRKFSPRSAPRDTPLFVHNAVNGLLQKTFGKPFRDGLFATGYGNDAAIYGKVHIVIPIGTFEWLCSGETDGNMRDLTGTYKRNVESIASSGNWNTASIEMQQDALYATIEDISSSEWYHNDFLQTCIKSENEIMLWCDSFYLIKIGSPILQDIYKLKGISQ